MNTCNTKESNSMDMLSIVVQHHIVMKADSIYTLCYFIMRICHFMKLVGISYVGELEPIVKLPQVNQ